MSRYQKPEAHRRGGSSTFRNLDAPIGRKVPPIPKGVSWPPEIRRWWRKVWVHPVSAEWDVVADLPAVRRLCDLRAMFESTAEPSAALLGQIVKLEGELLLTPGARRRAYVSLPVVLAQSAVQPLAAPSVHEYEHLRVVFEDDA